MRANPLVISELGTFGETISSSKKLGADRRLGGPWLNKKKHGGEAGQVRASSI